MPIRYSRSRRSNSWERGRRVLYEALKGLHEGEARLHRTRQEVQPLHELQLEGPFPLSHVVAEQDSRHEQTHEGHDHRQDDVEPRNRQGEHEDQAHDQDAHVQDASGVQEDEHGLQGPAHALQIPTLVVSKQGPARTRRKVRDDRNRQEGDDVDQSHIDDIWHAALDSSYDSTLKISMFIGILLSWSSLKQFGIAPVGTTLPSTLPPSPTPSCLNWNTSRSW